MGPGVRFLLTVTAQGTFEHNQPTWSRQFAENAENYADEHSKTGISQHYLYVLLIN